MHNYFWRETLNVKRNFCLFTGKSKMYEVLTGHSSMNVLV